MRWLLAMAVVFAPDLAAAKSSNPAFLGVGMGSIQAPTGVMCQISTVTKDSGAEAAGLRPGDVFVAVEGTPIGDCNSLVDAIQARESCETVKIDVRREHVITSVTAKLCSRAEVMRQRVVGQKLPITSLVSVEDRRASGLSSSGKTTIVGWFDQTHCVGCDRVFATLERWARNKSTRASQIEVVGAIAGDRAALLDGMVASDLKAYQQKLDVPLLVADPETFSDLSITDGDRIHFMVIDCRGIVQYATPLAPDADDKQAVLDEIFAAAEQAAHRLR